MNGSKGGVLTNEDDISAEEKAEIESPWVPFAHEHEGREKSSSGKKGEGKKVPDCLTIYDRIHQTLGNQSGMKRSFEDSSKLFISISEYFYTSVFLYQCIVVSF